MVKRAERGTPADESIVPRGWPAVRVEPRPWRTNPQQVGPDGARPNLEERMLSSIEVAIPPRIADLDVRLEPATVALVEGAAVAVARLESRAEHLVGLNDLLVRTEAVATSKIEHVYADLDEIARASVGAKAADSAARTVAAAQALRALTESADHGAPLTEDAILAAHRHLLADDKVEQRWAGRLREQQNWIGGSDLTPLGAVHVPPPHDEVRPLVDDLIAFANRRDMSALAQAAIVHAQFEAIHPFTDGNGRVGRGLIGAVLRRRGLTRTITVPAAAAMLADVDTYFDHLSAYRAGDVNAMVAYLSEAAVAAAGAAETSADTLAALPPRWMELVKPRKGSSAHTMIGALLRVPIFDSAGAAEMTGASPARTYEAIERLADAGILHEISRGARNRIWVVSDVMTEMKELEKRIGVRSRPSRRWR